MDTRAARATTLIRLVDEGNLDAIRFIRTERTVHVLAPADYLPERHRELFGDGEDERQMRFMLGEVWTVCGTRIVRHRSGFESGGQIVSHFPDEMLCQRCHAAFGDRSVLLFEANQDDGEDPTQLGRLTADTISKTGKALQ